MYIIPQRAKKSTNKIIKFDKKFTVSGVISIYLAYTIKNEVSNSRGIRSSIDGGALVRARIFALMGTLYGIWMIVSSGMVQVLITSILYAPGILVYMKGRREKDLFVFRRYEKNIAYIITALAILSLILLFTGAIDPF